MTLVVLACLIADGEKEFCVLEVIVSPVFPRLEIAKYS
jgi:hypothetical protein